MTEDEMIMQDFSKTTTASRCYLLGLRKSFEDYANLPTSMLITKAVDDNIERLKENNPDLTTPELLQLAYDIARRENPVTNDFITDDAAQPQKPQDPRKPKDPDNPEDIGEPEYFFAVEEPVSSSNIAEIGYDPTQHYGNLVVYFNNGSGYTYDVGPEVYKEMMEAGSKGSFLWNNLRGREPGHVIDDPSKTTPGGVGGSLVEYHKVKGSRMPIQAMEVAKEHPELYGGERKVSKETEAKIKITKEKEPSKEWKEVWKAAQKRQEKLEKAELREEEEGEGGEGVDPTKAILQTKLKNLQRGLKNAGSKIVRQAIQAQIDEITRQLERYSDFVKLQRIVSDMTVRDDSTILYGPITRGGEFVYDNTIKKKDYTQLKKVMGEVSHLPAFDSHDEDRLIGFAYDWDFNDKTEQIFGHVQTFKDIEEVSALREDLQDEFPVSIRFFDKSKADDLYQDIERVLHLAVSVNKTDTDRCSASGGKACYVSRTDYHENQESLQDSRSSSRSITNNNGTCKTIQQQETNKMTEKEKKEKKDDMDDEEEKDEDKKEKVDDEEEDEDEEDKEKKDKKKDEDDFVRIPSAEYKEFAEMKSRMAELEDFANTLKAKEQERRKKEEIDLRAELQKDPRVKSDMLEDTDLHGLKQLKDALVPLPDEKDDFTLQKGIKDFENGVTDFKKKYQKKWSTARGGSK